MDVSTLPDVDGKVAVVRRADTPADEENALTQVLFDAGATCVLVLNEDATIEALDDEQMRAHGWVRADG